MFACMEGEANMKPPARWRDIVIGLALGYNRQEIAAGLGESALAISNAVKDINSAAGEYSDAGEFLGELLGAELESELDTDAIQQFREEKEQEDSE